MIEELQKYQLILIDDNSIDQMLHRKIIEIVFPAASVKLFTEATTALKHIQANEDGTPHHTVIFLDIQMPVMNGFQFLEAFHLLPEDIKKLYTIYIVSSSVNQFDISKAKNNPYVKDMIIKPLTKETLLNLLH
ncbi:MAG: response regulator [Bacteroidota bacterium]